MPTIPAVARLGGIDWRLRGIAVFALASLIAILALAGAGFWHRPRLDIAAGIIIAACATAVAFRRTRDWLAHMDWRIAAILLVTALSVAVTCLGFDAGWDGDAAGKFPHDVFAGWVASIVFFGSIGLVVAVVSLVQPEEEGFESRARILFRGKDGEHIRYIVDRIRETLEHYAEDVIGSFTVLDYDPPERKFLVRVERTTVLRSYLDDVRTTYNSEIRVDQGADPPATKPAGRLVYLRVGNRRFGSRPFQNNSIQQDIETLIEPGGTCVVAYAIEVWIRADADPNTYAPVRYTRRMQLRVRNNLPGNETVRIRVNAAAGQGPSDLTLEADKEEIVCATSDLRPGVQAYDFAILPLT